MVKNRIKELRQKNSLTLKELGQKVGMANNTLSQYETGKREPKLETWQKLADFFNVPIPYIQGITISENDAVNMLVGWLNGSCGYLDFNMHRILIDHLKFYEVSESTIKSAMHNKELAKKLILEYVPLITRIPFLSKFDKKSLTDGRFENEIAILIGSGAERASAQISKIKFTNDEDRNFEIQTQLDVLFQDVYMKIDELSEKLQSLKK